MSLPITSSLTPSLASIAQAVGCSKQNVSLLLRPTSRTFSRLAWALWRRVPVRQWVKATYPARVWQVYEDVSREIARELRMKRRRR